MYPNAPVIFKRLWFVFGFCMIFVAFQSYRFEPSPYWALFFVFLWSLDLCINTAKENYGQASSIYKVMSKWGVRWAKWYDGGNDVYDPAYPFTMDMWHLLRDLRVYFFMAAMISVSGTANMPSQRPPTLAW